MKKLLKLLDMHTRTGNSFNVTVVFVLVLLLMLTQGTWAQTPKVADGVYYIYNNATKGPWYLWPSVTTNTGTGYRYITTNNSTEAPASTVGTVSYDYHDNTYCHWVVVNSGDNDNKVRLINPKLNQYLIIRDKSFGDRDMWLEPEITYDNESRSWFLIDGNGPSFHIRPPSDTSKGFNKATGEDKHPGLITSNDGNDSRGGLMQFAPGSTAYTFEQDLFPAPTITIDEGANTYTFSYPDGILPTGYSFLFTTNGEAPTVGGTEVKTWDGTTPQTIDGNFHLKVVIARYGVVLSEVAEQIVGTPEKPTITPSSDCSNMVTITADPAEAAIYYTTDGSTPSLSNGTRYTDPFMLNESCTIKAIANLGRSSEVATYTYEAASALPIINVKGKTVTISGEGEIRYTTNGDEPTEASGSLYERPFTLNSGTGNITIKAIAKQDGHIASCVAEKVARLGTFVNSLSEVLANLDGDLILTADIDASGYEGTAVTFAGTFDGAYYTISGLKTPLFGIVDGGTVKNVVLSGVDINKTGNVGAICGTAKGEAKIYNCGILDGTVQGGTNVGGLVGLIEAGSKVRVVNCYNYGTVSGSDYAAGIVGKNEGTIGDVRIALCMMYGNMTTGTNRSPIYGGNHTSNSQNFTEYNFWRSKANLTYTVYNDQLAIDKDEYLTRFPFYRHILNTHRELAAFFLFGETGETVSDITADEIAEIGHWALKKGVARYPIVEEWLTNTQRTTVDIAANLPNTTDKGAGKLLNNIGDDDYYTGDGTKVTAMGTNGYLTVNLSINGNSYSTKLPITDMDEANYDYIWGKVVLPFANEFSGWTRDYSKVCTGWKITAVTGGTVGNFANYNVADRDCTAKDLYANSDYIFAQGGNYIVPYGVTAISVTAHFANAFYLSDASYEVGYDSGFNNPTALGGDVPAKYHDQTIYTDLATLVGALSATTNPHDQAIVLVGNFHYRVKNADGVLFNTGKAVTIMSADEDNNQEPDYGWYMGNTHGRLEVPPLRFDFVPIVEMGMSSRVGNSMYPGVGIWHTRGWFELTENCVSIMTQCEINSYDFTNSDNGKGNNRWIANSGYFVQIVRARDGACNNLSYIQIGSNAYVKELYPGCHTDNTHSKTAVPIAVTGGQVDECYMTGYKAGGELTGNMIYFWCTGGKIDKFLGAYLEEPTAAGMTAKVDHALIGRFFGGGTSASARIKGDIDVTINNSKVDFYCGGPEFGDMYSGKNVATHATGTIFGEYYGAGFGGTSITYNREEQQASYTINNKVTVNFPISFKRYTDYRLKKSLGTDVTHTATQAATPSSEYGIGTCYKFENIIHSNGTNGVARFYTGYAQFSLATTGNVTNTLVGCKIRKLPAAETVLGKEATRGEFYGAGCQGMVNGSVTSTLTDCTVEGNAFGGGYKAESNEVQVYPVDAPTYSFYTRDTGIFSDFGSVEPQTFYWQQGDADHDEVWAGEGTTILYTSKDVNMTDLGNVTGAISLTIDGDSKIGTDGDSTTGSVYGGGNESKSLSNTTVTLKGNTEVLGDVFGGGNRGLVEGSATVNITE